MNKRGKTALVVDDDPMIRMYVATVLKGRSFRTLEAQNGLEAVQVYGSYHSEIVLVVTDVEMPVMGGLEAVARIREIDGDVAVLIASGRAEELAPGHPDWHWLSKPFSPAQLLQAVQQALGCPC